MRIEGVSVAFGALSVLDDVSIDVAPGEFVSIVGPSGCGKSTLFSVTSGLLNPTAGRVHIDDEDVTGSTGHCGYMFQQDLLFAWRTVEQNVALGLEVQGVRRSEARRRARDQLAEFGLGAFTGARPHELSGGMRQRAALARTVLAGHGVVLLDEPFGALDALTRTEMQDWLQGVWTDHRWTVLMVTHDVREAVYLSDRVLVLSPRPARIVDEVVVDLPRPRTIATLSDPRFTHLETTLLSRLRGSFEGAP